MANRVPSLLQTVQKDTSSILPGMIRRPFRVQFHNYKRDGLRKGLIDPIRDKTQRRYLSLKRSLRDKLLERFDMDQPKK